MKEDIKAGIIKTSRELFNRRGYGNVSMRDIAEEMGISPGNLTYHYRKKEDLIDVMIRDMCEDCRPPDVPKTLKGLNELFLYMQGRFARHTFCFLDYVQIAQLYPGIMRLQQEVMRNMSGALCDALKSLCTAKLIYCEQYPGQYESLTEVILLICACWAPQSRLENGLLEPSQFKNRVWSVIYPLLTETGVNTYHAEVLTADDLCKNTGKG